VSAAPVPGAPASPAFGREPARRVADVAERLAADLLSDVPVGMTLADPSHPDCPLVWVNEALTRMTGYRAAELLGRNCRILQQHEHGEQARERAAIRDAIANRTELTVVLRNFRKDGTPIWIELTLLHRRDAAGHWWVAGCQVDVTAREDAARRAPDAAAGTALEFDRCLVVDARRLVVQHASEAASKALGLAGGPEAMRGRPLLDLVAPSERARVEAALAELVDGTARRAAMTLRLDETSPRVEVLARGVPVGAVPPSRLLLQVADVRETPAAALPGVHAARALRLSTSGARLEVVLAEVCRGVETALPGALCSVLLASADGTTLTLAASPTLPFSYVRLPQGLRVAEGNGSCGTAAARRAVVVTTDIGTDPLWRESAASTLSLGLRACWSTPMLGAGGRLLGTLAVWHRGVHSPSDEAVRTVDSLLRIAELAIEHDRARRARHQAETVDGATGLPNRLGLGCFVAERFPQDRVRSTVALFVVDVDGYKELTLAFGDARAERLLGVVGQRVRDVFPAFAYIARRAADGFVVVAEYPYPREVVEQLAGALCAAVSEPIEDEREELRLTASVGATLVRPPTDSLSGAMRDADVALQTARRLGPGRFRLHCEAVPARTANVFSLDAALRRALQRREFVLHYQPRFRASDRRLTAVEALLRWRHPTRGLLGAGEFVPQAEESGFIVELGRWVLEEACRQGTAWQVQGCRPVSVAVNVSAKQVSERFFGEEVGPIAERAGFPLERLELEITESTLVDASLAEAFAALRALRERGVRVLLDDFGTGWSSLAYLHRIPLDGLKIDRSFVQGMAGSREAAAVSTAIVALARALNLGVTAEGVETEDQLRRVVELGCDDLQGFLLSKPLSAAALGVLLGTAAL